MGFHDGQAEAIIVDEMLADWMRTADLLNIPDGAITFRLRMMQEYIASTPPEERCPCRKGVVLRNGNDHWIGCTEGEALRLNEDAWDADLDRQQLATTQHQAFEASMADYNRNLTDRWRGVAATSRLDNAQLRRIARDINDEVLWRYLSKLTYIGFLTRHK